MEPLRVAAVSYLNAQPLVVDLQADPRLAVELCPPSEASRRLLAGEADIGLIPCVSLLDDAGLTHLPGLGIGARGPVDSVFLYLRSDVDEGRAQPPFEVRLDPGSRSSQMLTRLYLEEMRTLPPESLIYREGALSGAFDGPDSPAAVLVIGDPALGLEAPEGYRRIDLADAWRLHTGFPFVFAVWGLKQDLLNRHSWLPQRFAEALRTGLADLPRIVDQFPGSVAVDRSSALTYLRENIAFELGEREEAGMSEFLRRAAAKRR